MTKTRTTLNAQRPTYLLTQIMICNQHAGKQAGMHPRDLEVVAQVMEVRFPVVGIRDPDRHIVQRNVRPDRAHQQLRIKRHTPTKTVVVDDGSNRVERIQAIATQGIPNVAAQGFEATEGQSDIACVVAEIRNAVIRLRCAAARSQPARTDRYRRHRAAHRHPPAVHVKILRRAPCAMRS